MKKEIEMKRKKQDELETEKMLDIIHQNHQRAKQEVEKKEKKDKSENIVVGILITITIILVGVMSIMFLHKDNQDFMKKCAKAGYTENYCRSQL